MTLSFLNNGQLSLIDLLTMGDSNKRDDPNKIGKFDSGLKYAIAILLRNNVNISIYVKDSAYYFDTIYHKFPDSDKTKELIRIKEMKNQKDGSWKYVKHHITSWAVNLGHDWEFWMAIRELYANCLDEGGYISWDKNSNTKHLEDVVIKLKGDKITQFKNKWVNYFNRSDFEFKHNNIKILPNNTNYLCVYKNGILVYENKDKKAIYSYDYSEAELDERRIMINYSDFISELRNAFSQLDSTAIDIMDVILNNEKDKVFESSISFGQYISDDWIGYLKYLYSTNNLPFTNSKFVSQIKANRSIDLGYRKEDLDDFNYNAFTQVEVKLATDDKTTIKNENSLFKDDVEISFEDYVKSIAKSYNFEIKFKIIKSEIETFSVVASKSENVLFVNKDFDESKMWELVKAHYRLDKSKKENSIYKDYINLLKHGSKNSK